MVGFVSVLIWPSIPIIHVQEPSFGIGSDVLSPRRIGSPSAENVELGPQCFATMQTTSENFLISCGNWENSFQVISLNDGRMVQSIRQHRDVVSCVAGIFHNLKTKESLPLQVHAYGDCFSGICLLDIVWNVLILAYCVCSYFFMFIFLRLTFWTWFTTLPFMKCAFILSWWIFISL